MQAQTNYFEKFNSIDVSKHVEQKGQFSYLSWAWAVQELGKLDSEATWEVKRFNDLPYLETKCGYFVEVAVTCAGVTKSQIHPVLDNRNQPIKEPNSFQINTSIQRCLVKAIALHGLGLYIYAGEDLPEAVQEAAKYITKEQAEQIYLFIDSNFLELSAWLQWFEKKFGAKELSKLPADSFDKVMAALERGRINKENAEKIETYFTEGNGFSLYMLKEILGLDGWTAAHRVYIDSVERGGKGVIREKIDKLVRDGETSLAEFIVDLELAQDDSIAEMLDELSPDELAYVKSKLSPEAQMKVAA